MLLIDSWCYLPVAEFLTFNEEPEQYLFAYVLRPGNAGAAVGELGILSRLVPRLRAAFPRARLRVRLDGGFAAPQIFAFLEREGLEYAVAMGKNKVLERRTARLMGTARRLSRESGETEHLYKECRYAAGTWNQRRRVIIKAASRIGSRNCTTAWKSTAPAAPASWPTSCVGC